MPETSQPAELPFLQKSEERWEVSQGKESGCAGPRMCQGFTQLDRAQSGVAWSFVAVKTIAVSREVLLGSLRAG